MSYRLPPGWPPLNSFHYSHCLLMRLVFHVIGGHVRVNHVIKVVPDPCGAFNLPDRLDIVPWSILQPCRALTEPLSVLQVLKLKHDKHLLLSSLHLTYLGSCTNRKHDDLDTIKLEILARAWEYELHLQANMSGRTWKLKTWWNLGTLDLSGL